MKRNALIAAIAAALVSAAALAAGPGGGYGFGGGPGMGGRYGGGGNCAEQGLNALGLTAEQRSAIATIQAEFSGKRLDLMEAMQGLRNQAFRENRQGDPSTYAAREELREQMFALRREQQERIQAVLTPEQLAVWRARPGRGGGWPG